MGIRFRRSIKIAPGVRMNVGKRGISSIGVGGFNFGSRGVHHTVSIPGTGISYRSKVVGRSHKQKAASAKPQKSEKAVVPVNLSLQDDGSVIYKDSKGRLLPDQLVRMTQKQNKELILQWLQEQCDKYNEEIESLSKIHLTTPAPAGEIVVNPKPEPPNIKPHGLMSRLLASQHQKTNERNRQAQQEYEEALLAWEKAEQTLKTDVEVMSAVLSSALASIEWPRETFVSFDIVGSGSIVLLDVELPPIEEMPTQQLQVSNRDMRLVRKDRSQAQIQLDYLAHIHAIGFRLIGDVFAYLSSASTVVFSGYSQRVNKKTGQVGDEYLYSTRVSRAIWEQVNFDNLEAIDVIACFERFELRRKVTQRGIISEVEPFTE